MKMAKVSLGSGLILRSAMALAIVGMGTVRSARGTLLLVYGGPTYDSNPGTGYQNPQFSLGGGTFAGNGTAAVSVTKYSSNQNVGQRAVRWDASGTAATELGNLGTSNGYTNTGGTAVNAAGTVVGSAEKFTGGTDFGIRAVRWDASGTAATELGNIGTDSSGFTADVAYAVNNAGTTAGYGYKYSGNTYLGERAVRWAASGTAAAELGNLGTDSSGSTHSRANAINTAGTAVGFAEKYSGNTDLGERAVRWDASGTAVTELGNIGANSSGGTNSVAYAINTAGTAVGIAQKYSGNTFLGQRAVRWDASGTAATELANLGTDSSGNTSSQAYAINDAGTTVGIANKYSGNTSLGPRAVRWNASGTAATELGNLGTTSGGATQCYAYAINSAGLAVGFAQKYTGGTYAGDRAVLWGPSGVAIDLNTLLSSADASKWTLTSACGISDTNWVTGIGIFNIGTTSAYQRAFLIQVPEPSSFSLLAIGGATLLRRRRRAGAAAR